MALPTVPDSDAASSSTKLPATLLVSENVWASKPPPVVAQPSPPASPYQGDAAFAVQMLAGWLESELISRLSMLDSKLDSLKESVEECHEGIHLSPSDETRKGKKKGKKKTSCNGELDEVSRARQESSSSSKQEGARFNEPQQLADHSSNPQALEVARWAEEPAKQPELLPIEVSTQAEPQPSKASWEAMLDDPDYSITAKIYTRAMPLFVVISVVCTLLQTISERPLSGMTAAVIEVTAETVFVIDLAIRFTVFPDKARFLCRFHNVIDVLVALPLAVRISLGLELSEDEMETFPGSMLLYILPLVRLLKTLRGLKTFSLIVKTVARVYLETWPTMLALVYIVLFWSSIMYYVEPRDNIPSYPTAIWFVIVTMTTVGYGDISPVTGAGYLAAGIMVCTTMFVMALPLGIIGTAVSEIWGERHTILLRSWARERLSQWGYTASDIPRFLEAFDSDGSGELDFSEFCAMLDEMKLAMKPEKMRQLFDSFDEDKSGAIDSTEFISKLYPSEKERKKLGEVGEQAIQASRDRMGAKLEAEASRRSVSKELMDLDSIPQRMRTPDAQPSDEGERFLNTPSTPS